MSHPLGLRLQRGILHDREAAGQGVAHPPLPLLHHMRERVADQLASGRRLRLVVIRREVEIHTDREGTRTDALRLRPDMDAHPLEAGMERPLHLQSQLLGQPLPGTDLAEHRLVDPEDSSLPARRVHRRRPSGRGLRQRR